MSSWEAGFVKVASIADVMKKLKGKALQDAQAAAARASRRADRVTLRANPKGGYASIDEGSVPKAFNPSGFLRGTKHPSKT